MKDSKIEIVPHVPQTGKKSGTMPFGVLFSIIEGISGIILKRKIFLKVKEYLDKFIRGNCLL